MMWYIVTKNSRVLKIVKQGLYMEVSEFLPIPPYGPGRGVDKRSRYTLESALSPIELTVTVATSDGKRCLIH